MAPTRWVETRPAPVASALRGGRGAWHSIPFVGPHPVKPMTVIAPAPVSTTVDDPIALTAPEAGGKPERVVSLDALRGFDMIWILGGEEVIKALATAFPNRFTNMLK